MMLFPSVSDSPLFSKNFWTLRKIFTILPFSDKFLDFHPPKFLMTFFLVIDHKFRIPPYFPCFNTFPPLFRENYYFRPTLTMMHLCITQCTYWTPLPILFLRYDTSAITTDCNRSQTLSPWLDPPLHRNEMRSLAIDCAGE